MSTPPSISQPLSSYDVALLRECLLETAINSACYGIQVALSIAAISALVRKEGRAWILATAVIALYIASTTDAATSIMWNLVQMPVLGVNALDIDINAILHDLNALSVASTHVNYLVSDALVAWRAWILWPYSRIIHGVLLLCMTGTLAGAIAESVWAMRDPFSSAGPAKLSLSIDLPVWVTNIVATTFVGVQVWFHRRHIISSLGPFSKESQVGRILIILLESGLGYCSILTTIIALDLTNNNGAAYRSIYTVAYKLASIYPIFVVFVVTAQEHLTAKSIIGGQSSFLASLQFVPGVSAPTQSEPVSSTGHDSEDIELVTRSQPADVQ
ncbi:hypothetical protein BD626DRAFT_150908 [Schizophyllum amplum]|uniref:Uncharacterized protein n=1 Tax=Schizophyllum amplum TaxID=97359 RepID=A0A550C469_9AGAR|nr:hypothetical protein BD626DRAFT_150908 [Auriculariopsis ampla]